MSHFLHFLIIYTQNTHTHTHTNHKHKSIPLFSHSHHYIFFSLDFTQVLIYLDDRQYRYLTKIKQCFVSLVSQKEKYFGANFES